MTACQVVSAIACGIEFPDPCGLGKSLLKVICNM